MRIFIASAMEQQDEDKRAALLTLREGLALQYGRDSVFLACHAYPTPEQYPSPQTSLALVLEHVQASDLFILYYPRQTYSGAFIELGYALACKKPVLILTPSVASLPYILQAGAQHVTIEVIPEDLVSAFGALTQFLRVEAFIEGLQLA